MKAVLLCEYGGPEKFRYGEIDTPQPGDNDAPMQFPVELGRDLAGEVVETGRTVTGFNKGMRVTGPANGAYADYTVAKRTCWLRFPMR